MTSIKKLNEVMRNPRLFAQTKSIYAYLWVRADYKSGLSYPPREQLQQEINLTDKQIDEGLSVLEKFNYIKPTTKDMVSSKGQEYQIKCYDIIGDVEDTKDVEIQEDTKPKKKSKSKSKDKG